MSVVTLLTLAGIGQICLAIGSTAIPGILRWPEELAKVNAMTRHMFWTYAGYILVINFSFGLISLLAPHALSNGSLLASAVTGFIALYWISRIIIQFAVFDRRNFPSGPMHRTGEVVLVALFFFLTAVYVYAFYCNIQ